MTYLMKRLADAISACLEPISTGFRPLGVVRVLVWTMLHATWSQVLALHTATEQPKLLYTVA